MALIGSPPILILGEYKACISMKVCLKIIFSPPYFLQFCEIIDLDEPTRGVDPFSRHKLWSVIKNVASSKRTVIFTSFNTEECEDLADRIVVMAEGNIQCIGKPRQLIDKYSRGMDTKKYKTKNTTFTTFSDS